MEFSQPPLHGRPCRLLWDRAQPTGRSSTHTFNHVLGWSNVFMWPMHILFSILISLTLVSPILSCACMNVYTWLCAWVHVHICLRRMEPILRCHVRECHLPLLRQGLLLAWSSSIWLDWLARETQGSSCLSLPSSGGLHTCTHDHCYYMSAGDWI